MKKIIYAIVGLISISALAQTQQVEFTQKLTYKIESGDIRMGEDLDKVRINHYIGKNNTESLINGYDIGFYGAESELNLFVKNQWLAFVNISGISQNVSYSFYDVEKLIRDHKVIVKINRTGSFNGLNCQYYTVLNNENDKENYETCFCIDENNEIDNAGILFFEKNVKGLIVSIEPKVYEDFRLVYQSAENTNLTLNLDTEKMLADIEGYYSDNKTEYGVIDAVQETAVLENEYSTAYEDRSRIYNDPLYSYGGGNFFDNYELYNYVYPIYGITTNLLYNTEEYSYNKLDVKYSREQILKFYKKSTKNLVKDLSSSKLITSEEKKILNDFFKKQAEEAENFKPDEPKTPQNPEDYSGYDYAADAAMDSIAPAYSDYDYGYNYYTKYQSQYKNVDAADVSLAYDTLDSEELKKNAPDYCKELQSKIPDFQNKELKIYVHNFAGQICDLYLYNNGGYVGYFETIDSMRKSLLEIEKLRNSLSDNDQKLLLEFIKNLD